MRIFVRRWLLRAGIVLLLSTGACKAGSRGSADELRPPAIAAASLVFQPQFSTRDGELRAGKAVPIRVAGAPNGVLVVSCHHIFGPNGGLRRAVGAASLPSFIQRAVLESLDGKQIEIGPAWRVPGAKGFKLPDMSHDLSVFDAPAELAARALELAPELPKNGERIWLLSRLMGGAPADQLLHAAEVRHADDKFLGYQFDSNELELRATSGAPMVNAKGQLVGLNLGGGPLETGELTGFAIPVTSLKRGVEQALELRAPQR